MKIGDKVSVVDEDLSGVITSVHGERIVFKDEFGFTYQYDKKKLVPKDPEIYENIRIEKKAEPKKVASKKHHNNILVLDLHFHNLVNNPNDLWYSINTSPSCFGSIRICNAVKGY